MLSLYNIFNVAGWVGTLLILLAFAASSADRLRRGGAYYLMNLFGAAGVAINSWWHGAYPPAALNLAWFAVAVYGLARLRGSSGPADGSDQSVSDQSVK